ncbi:MAG: hypothetical protein IT303_02065 [Dehalococcoidia bacterium]|nr:hypothetical protein [Dehalococcoidia bacterium]
MRQTRALVLSVAVNFVLVGVLVARSADDPVPPTSDAGETPARATPALRTAEPSASPTGTTQPAADNSLPAPRIAPSTADGAGVVYTFDGAPPGPETALRIEGWDTQAHSRRPETWHTMEAMEAQHGPACEAPAAAHHVSEWEDTVFGCNNHIMTALNASDYGVIYLTPGALVDFSGGAAIVQWDMSTHRQSVRDWPDVWISAYDENLALPLDGGLPDLQGPPENAIHVSFNTTEFTPILTVVRDGVEDKRGNGWEFPTARGDIAPGTNQAATRQTFRLTLEAGRVTFERLASPTATYIRFWSHAIPELGFRQGVVQFGHHSYTPTKDNSGVPGTWHWDNIRISPARPFTILQANERFVEGDGGTVTFPAPAAAGAHLRFGAIGRVKVDGRDIEPVVPTEKAEHFNSYWVPIPEGTTQVTVELDADGWYEGPFFARDFSIWAGGD